MPETPEMLSILMPVYNERAFLRRCVERVLAAPLPNDMTREIVMVDDGSDDGTADLVDELAAEHPETIRAFHQPRNIGKGAAVRRAVAEMRGHYAVVQDADLEYDPDEYGVLLAPVLAGKADVVYGSRFASRTMWRVLNYHHMVGNTILTHLSNACTGLNLTDMETCYKLFKADILRRIPIRSNRFGFEPEITAKTAALDCVVYEAPVSYHGRTYAEGKKIGWRDGLAAVATILKYAIIDDCHDPATTRRETVNPAFFRRVRRMTVDRIEPWLGDRIMEVGAGAGDVSRLLPKRERLTLTDPDAEREARLAETYRYNELVETDRFDMNADADADRMAASHDTVVCLDMLARVEDDAAAVRRLRRVLTPGGRLVCTVPRYSRLFGTCDRRLGNLRRYDAKALSALMESAGLRILRMSGLNAAAMPVWWAATTTRRERLSLPERKLVDVAAPLLGVLDGILPTYSLLCIAERPA